MRVEQVISADLFFKKLPDGSAAIFDARSDTVYSLNATAAAAWEECKGASSVADVIAKTRAPEETVVEAFLQMQEKGLVKVSAVPAVYFRRTAAQVPEPAVAALTSVNQLLDLRRKIDPSSGSSQRIRTALDRVERVTRCSRELVPDIALPVWPTLQRLNRIEGWLNKDEADLLMASTALALNGFGATALVEVGSYCGRSTCVIATVLKALGASAKLYAVDPHEGRVGAEDLGIEIKAPTLDKLRENLQAAGVTDHVVIVKSCSFEVVWNQPVSLLFIDGLHDYGNIARDFRHFEPWLKIGGYAVFHDYTGNYPGVITFIDELMSAGCYDKVDRAGGLLVLRREREEAKA